MIVSHFLINGQTLLGDVICHLVRHLQYFKNLSVPVCVEAMWPSRSVFSQAYLSEEETLKYDQMAAAAVADFIK